MKRCPKCGNDERTVEFYERTVNGKRYPSSWCKGCKNTQKKRKRAEGAWDQAAHAHQLRFKFGMTQGMYDRLLAQQGGRCAICRAEEGHRSKSGQRAHLAVDHCKTSGVVRGLLCNRCNRALGFFQHDPERLEQAIRYLGGRLDGEAGR